MWNGMGKSRVWGGTRAGEGGTELHVGLEDLTQYRPNSRCRLEKSHCGLEAAPRTPSAASGLASGHKPVNQTCSNLRFMYSLLRMHIQVNLYFPDL